jgi:hypothetical protein
MDGRGAAVRREASLLAGYSGSGGRGWVGSSTEGRAMTGRNPLLIVVCVLSLVTVGCASTVELERPQEIVYRVSGTASSAKIIYINETNGTTNVESGIDSLGKMYWTRRVLLRPGEMAYVTAQNQGAHGKSDSVIAEILYQDKVIKHSESRGDYCVATVSVRILLQ